MDLAVSATITEHILAFKCWLPADSQSDSYANESTMTGVIKSWWLFRELMVEHNDPIKWLFQLQFEGRWKQEESWVRQCTVKSLTNKVLFNSSSDLLLIPLMQSSFTNSFPSLFALFVLSYPGTSSSYIFTCYCNRAPKRPNQTTVCCTGKKKKTAKLINQSVEQPEKMTNAKQTYCTERRN